jgi:alanyl-tRNA synthetase
MGLERLTRVLQGVDTDYDTDLFTPIMAAIRALPHGTKAKRDQVAFAERAIADHLRAIMLLVAEGLTPSNEGRGYVLRMLIRRAHRLGRVALDVMAGDDGGFLHALTPAVETALAGSPYAALLSQKRAHVAHVIQQEEVQFIGTLQAGTARLDELIAEQTRQKRTVIAGAEAFKLYDTYGFPLELTIDIAAEQGLTIERAGFDQALKAQQERSRAGSQFSGGVFVADALEIRATIPALPSKEALFVGYEQLVVPATIKGLWDGAKWIEQAREGQQVAVVLDRSPFYGEAGGQVGDGGRLEGPSGAAEVSHTTWVDEVLVHHATVRQGSLKLHEPVQARVDLERRLKVARSHTAAHVLHWALRKVLGPETMQAGSYVETERVRFDFSSRQGLHEEQRAAVEAAVNARARLADAVITTQMRVQEAKQAGALALFGEKYGDQVRVVTIGDYSKELCGGTHLPHTGLLGSFVIVGESSIAAGTRRVEALVGQAAAELQQSQARLLHDAAKRLGRSAEDVVAGVEELLEQLKRGERERKNLQLELAKVEAGRLVAQGQLVNGATVITATIVHADRDLLSALADATRSQLKTGVVLLVSTLESRDVAWVMALTADLVARKLHAGALLKEIAAVTQGGGGGRPDFAQAGGKDASKIAQALKRADELLRKVLT